MLKRLSVNRLHLVLNYATLDIDESNSTKAKKEYSILANVVLHFCIYYWPIYTHIFCYQRYQNRVLFDYAFFAVCIYYRKHLY
jgi:hypothetical protein